MASLFDALLLLEIWWHVDVVASDGSDSTDEFLYVLEPSLIVAVGVVPVRPDIKCESEAFAASPLLIEQHRSQFVEANGEDLVSLPS